MIGDRTGAIPEIEGRWAGRIASCHFHGVTDMSALGVGIALSLGGTLVAILLANADNSPT